MANQFEVSIEIIVHATEDSRKIIRSFSDIFDLKESQFKTQHLTGHFENPILLLSTRITKNRAEAFVQKLVLKIPKEELRKVIDTLENRIQNSSLHLRFAKQELIVGKLILQEKDAIKVKIHMSIYTKQDVVTTYNKVLTKQKIR